MPTFDVAVVGTGGIAAVHAADLSTMAGRARIVAAVDTDPVRLAAFARRWSVPRRYPDLADLLAGQRPDVVVLCSPPGLHAAQATACLERGITVLCEKPPATSLAELDAVAAAERTGAGHFATVFQHRFGGGGRSLRRLATDPRLGRPLVAVCHTLWFRPPEYFAVPWRGRWDTEGGGPTLGHGIHQIDLLRWALGPWQEVVAVAARLARPTDTEDVSAAVVRFAGGTVATVLNSLLSARETSYLRVDFEHATVELRHLYGYSDADWTLTPAPGHAEAVTRAWAEGLPGAPSGHAAQLAAVFDALAAGDPPPVTTVDARDTLELVTAVYASAFTGRPVARGEIGPDSPFYHRLDGHGAPWAEPAGASPPEPAGVEAAP